jgi:hypothetical protein
VKAAFASGGEEDGIQSVATFEDEQVVFRGNAVRPVAFIDGQAVLERSHRLEFGIERVLDNHSNVEATAFFDTTSGRGVGLMSLPATSFSGTMSGDEFMHIADQQGSSRGMRVVYTRRLNRVWTASAGYAFGRGQRWQRLVSRLRRNCFENGFFPNCRPATRGWLRQAERSAHRVALLAGSDRVCDRSFCRPLRCFTILR